jgi:glycosyltransferase involved in cell wall biosynthesis
MNTIAPLSAVIATRDREQSLGRTLNSLLQQEVFPAEVIVVDSSEDDATKSLLLEFGKGVSALASACWIAADVAGAAAQRNQGVALSTQPFLWFFDDDILFEPNCVERLWKAIELDGTLGGVNAMIVNQQYGEPGFVSRAMFTLMHGRSEKTFAGKVIGPAINLLPEDREDLPEVAPVEWLNTTCTIYRREALPNPPFDSFFNGYSFMEDVALSLRVGKKWRLANVREATIRHESQSGVDKKDASKLAKMELINRHYVMTNVLNRKRFEDFSRLAIWEIFSIISGLTQSNGVRSLPSVLAGKFLAVAELRKTGRHP